MVVVGKEQCAEQAGIYRIDDELSIFSGIGNEHPIPSTNLRLKRKTDAGFVQDDFGHEQCLVIREGAKSVLLSGCAHHGILNILDRYYELYGDDPDVVISGFHMMRKNGYPDEDINMIIGTGASQIQDGVLYRALHRDRAIRSDEEAHGRSAAVCAQRR